MDHSAHISASVGDRLFMLSVPHTGYSLAPEASLADAFVPHRLDDSV